MKNEAAESGSDRVLRAAGLTLVVAFFTGILFTYLEIPVWDYDFWWHLSTGRFIVAEKHLPDKDPFSLTTDLTENKNPFPEVENLILKQYWLAQIVFYLMYEYAGFQGIIILRAILLFLTLLVVYRHMARSGAFPFVSLILIFLLYKMTLLFTGERPVLFTIFFTAVSFALLDDSGGHRGKKIFLLVPLMLLWANLHGGYIIGDLFLLIFMFGEAVRGFLKKSDYSPHEKRLFFGVATAALLVSLINPTGLEAFYMALSSRYAVLKETIQEWQSPFFLISNHLYPATNYYPYFALVAIFLLLVLARNKKMNLTSVLAVSVLCYESAISSRMTIYFMIPAAVVAAGELSVVLRSAFGRLQAVAVRRAGHVLTLAVAALLCVLMTGQLQGKSLLANGVNTSTVPVGAVDFIEKNKIQGNLFNDYAFGGYVIWRLYPWKKDFVDTRALNIVTMKENDFIVNARSVGAGNEEGLQKKDIHLYEELLDHYKINILFFSLTKLYGDVTPLVLRLVEDDRWVPVYCDGISIIYVGNIPENEALIRKYRLTNEVVLNSIIFRCSSFALRNPVNPRPLLAMGDVFYKMGRPKDSLQAYRYALKRDPGNAFAREMIGKIQAEMAVKGT